MLEVVTKPIASGKSVLKTSKKMDFCAFETYRTYQNIP